MSALCNVSLVREESQTATYLVVGDTRFWVSSLEESTALALDRAKIRVVQNGSLAQLVERRLQAPPTVLPSQVFFDCGTDFDSVTGRWHFNCQPSASLVRRHVLIAGWIDEPYVNDSNHGVEDVLYNVLLDAVFLERMYGPDGLSTALRAAFYPGNPRAPYVLLFGETPAIGGQPRRVTFNSWILPGSGPAMHRELNAWHQSNTGPLFSRHFVGRGPAPAFWINPLPQDTDAWFPFNPLDPDGSGVPLHAGDYVVMRGALWEDTWHDQAGAASPWDSGGTLNHAWPEIHPVDWIVRVRGPGPNARLTPGSVALCTPDATGPPLPWSDTIRPGFELFSATRRLEVRGIRAETDTRLTLPASVVSVTTTPASDHVDVAATVQPLGFNQGRFKGSWLVGWREMDVLDRPWVDDALPAGAQPFGDGEAFEWVTNAPEPFAGTVCHRSALLAGSHQHYFTSATAPMEVNAGDTLFAMVHLDPEDPPDEVMLQWFTSGWLHRAFWGADRLPWGAPGTAERIPMGGLPFAGEWARLEVPASAVGLEGRSVTGMAFTLFGGRASWDYAGVRGALPVTYGATLRLAHVATRRQLHSLPYNYVHPGTSGQQLVAGVTVADADADDDWQIKGPHGQPEGFGAGQPIQHGAVVRLTHVATDRNLHSHRGFPSPVTVQQEVTCFGQNGVGDDNDNWRVEVPGEGRWVADATVRLIHQGTNVALHSHGGYAHPLWTLGLQEVTGFAGRDDNDLWTVVALQANPRAATFLGQSAPATMIAGRDYDVSLTFRNAGTDTWTPAALFRLARSIHRTTAPGAPAASSCPGRSARRRTSPSASESVRRPRVDTTSSGECSRKASNGSATRRRTSS